MGSHLPYDAEVEWLGTDGRQGIDTGIYPTALNLTIEMTTQNLLRFGWAYNNNANGTWIGIVANYAHWKNWNNGYKYAINNYSDGKWNVWTYSMKNGLYKNGTLIKSFTATLGTSPIAEFPLILIGYYDAYIQGNRYVSLGYDVKISDCKIYKDAELVRDFIPVRKGQVGYLYDKVSGQLFGNAGTGSFILGSDR
jgi:hypothetical protein